MQVYRILSAALLLLPVAGAALQSGPSPQSGPGPPSAAQLEAGRRVYEREKCTECHQIARRGNSRFPLDGVGGRLKPEEIRRWLTHTAQMEDALPRMPPVRMSARKYRLSTTDLNALVAYLGSLK